MRRSWIVPSLALLFLFGTLTGCQVSQSAFARTAGNAGSAFAAASTTLAYAHAGKLTTAYAQSSFVAYQSELSNVDQQLPSQKGAPDTHSMQHLLQLYKMAMSAINHPCLTTNCDWQTQVAKLNHASDAFLKASGQ